MIMKILTLIAIITIIAIIIVVVVVVCVYIYIYIYICTHTCVHVHIYTYMLCNWRGSLRGAGPRSERSRDHGVSYHCVYTHMFICTYTRVTLNLNVYVYVYYLYIYIYMYIYIYICNWELQVREEVRKYCIRRKSNTNEKEPYLIQNREPRVREVRE